MREGVAVSRVGGEAAPENLACQDWEGPIPRLKPWWEGFPVRGRRRGKARPAPSAPVPRPLPHLLGRGCPSQ